MLPSSSELSSGRVSTPVHTSVLFNGSIAAAALAAAFELGLLEQIHTEGGVCLREFCERRDLHLPSIEALAYALACFEIVERREDEDLVAAGVQFREAYREKGYFLWLVKGYGHLWQHLAQLCANANRSSDPDNRDFVRRDGKSIAIAGRDYGAAFVDPYVDAVIDEDTCDVAADLGCGSAARLIALARARPSFRGLGIDINSETVRLARESVRAAGVEDRVTILQGDVRALTAVPGFDQVDMLCCFFMGHDLWPRARCGAVLRNLRTIFPAVRRFLLCDTFRADAAPSPVLPTFQLGFECSHALMGQVVPSRAEWLSLFSESGWRCGGMHPIEIPASAIFDLRPIAAGATADDEFPA